MGCGPILLHLRCGSAVLSHRLSELQEAAPPAAQPPQPQDQAPCAAYERAAAEDGKVAFLVGGVDEGQGPEARVLQFHVPATALPRAGLAFLETSCGELLGPWLPLLVLPNEAAATEVSEMLQAHGADRCVFRGTRFMIGVAGEAGCVALHCTGMCHPSAGPFAWGKGCNSWRGLPRAP